MKICRRYFFGWQGGKRASQNSQISGCQTIKSWSFSTVLNHSYYSNPDGLEATLWGSQLRASKSLTFFRKPTQITLSCFNPLNIQAYQRLLTSDYLILQDEVEAVAPYLLLNWDITF